MTSLNLSPVKDLAGGRGGGPFFGLLPDELLLQILLLIPQKDIVLRLTQIGNPRITRLCQDPQLWSHLKVADERTRDGLYPFYKMEALTSLKMISKAGNCLKELTLYARGTGNEYRMLALVVLTSCRSLESLRCDQGLINNELMRAVSESRSLQRLSAILNARRMGGEMLISEFASHLPFLKNLTWIDVAYLKLYSHGSADYVRALADSCGKLEVLALCHYSKKSLNDENFSYLLEKLGRGLKGLMVWGLRLTDASICNLKNCPLLERLYLYEMEKLGREGLDVIAGLSTRLTKLAVTGSKNLTEQDLVEVFAGRRMDRLRYLSLIGCGGISEVSIGAMGESCTSRDLIMAFGDFDVSKHAAVFSRKKISRLLLFGGCCTVQGCEESVVGCNLRRYHLMQIKGFHMTEFDMMEPHNEWHNGSLLH